MTCSASGSTVPSATGACTLVTAIWPQGVSDNVLERAFQYWKNVDPQLGERVEQAVGAGVGS
jgi:catalase